MLHAACWQVLCTYTLMATKSRPDVEAAVGQLLDMANADPSNVPVLLGLAHGFLLLKQTAKARNQLKVCRMRSCTAIMRSCHCTARGHRLHRRMTSCLRKSQQMLYCSASSK
jgi:hypothetical protein